MVKAGSWGANAGQRPNALAPETAPPAGWLEQLFEESPFGIALLDPKGSIVRCNGAFAQIFAGDRQRLAGQSFTALVAAEDRDDVAAQLAKLVMGTARHVSLENLRIVDDGRAERAAALFASAIVSNREITGLLTHVQDTTDRRNLEVNFAHAQKLQALGQLAGSIAHDFNNLITGMLGACESLLNQHPPSDPSHEDLAQISATALRARELVSQLLAFARKQPLRPVALRIDLAIDALVPMLRRLLGPNIRIATDYFSSVPVVRMDPGQFDQVIVNLAVNARDAMPDGGELMLGIKTMVLSEPARWAAEILPAGPYVVVEVSDTGSGISKSIIDNIFEPFFTTKRTGEGAGLGLATVYGIVRQSGGYIIVESVEDVGTIFRIHLPAVGGIVDVSGGGRVLDRPVAAAAAAVAAGASVAGDASDAVTEQAKTVLLVDDEDTIRRFAARALRARGYDVLEAADGDTALEMLSTGDGRVDVLLTDLILPGIDGWALAAQALAPLPQLKVVIISAHLVADEDHPVQGDSRYSVLPKPFTLADLAQHVKRVLDD
jgi:two-component system, cell cycle sensor histidine kinase and response regulator CckA